MGDTYSVSCDYGGLGNFQEGDTACMLCPHEIECSHEQELAELAVSRSRRVGGGSGGWRYPDRSTSGIRKTVGGTVTRSSGGIGIQPSGRRRSRRPMPIVGENPLVRAGKNVLMTMLSSGFHEAGDFCEDHDFAHVVDGSVVAAALPASDKKKE